MLHLIFEFNITVWNFGFGFDFPNRAFGVGFGPLHFEVHLDEAE